MRVSQAHVLTRIGRAQAVLLALAGFAWLGAPATAAEKHQSPLTTILNTKFHADPGHVPDFVEKSRPAGNADYIPLRTPEAGRHAKPKTAAELKAMEMDLEAAGAANRRRAGRSAEDAPAKRSGKVSTVRSGPPAPIH
ncbi:MAG: hypothetical protein QOG66_3102 [Methylobacteriaceae bacterium]|nr:hypothetical protein [Methylobacteriaceae bacterium]